MAAKEAIHFSFGAQLSKALASDEWRMTGGTEHGRNVSREHSSYQSIPLNRLATPPLVPPEAVAEAP